MSVNVLGLLHEIFKLTLGFFEDRVKIRDRFRYFCEENSNLTLLVHCGMKPRVALILSISV